MKIRFQGSMVEVRDSKCLHRPCLWKTQRNGVSTLGTVWRCGYREQQGCPQPIPEPHKRGCKCPDCEARR